MGRDHASCIGFTSRCRNDGVEAGIGVVGLACRPVMAIAVNLEAERSPGGQPGPAQTEDFINNKAELEVDVRRGSGLLGVSSSPRDPSAQHGKSKMLLLVNFHRAARTACGLMTALTVLLTAACNDALLRNEEANATPPPSVERKQEPGESVQPIRRSDAPLALAHLFSRAQAERGETVFASDCASCHSAAATAVFAFEGWQGKPLGAFFDQVRKTMPPESMGNLSNQDYLDVLAYSFRESGVALGDDDAIVEDAAWRNVVISGEAAADKAASPSFNAQPLEWRAYRGDVRSQAYSPADQINPDNVSSLKIDWVWSGRNFGPSPELKNITTPLMIDGVLYFTAGVTRDVVAVDAVTGETLWMWRPDEGARFENAPRKGAGRGVSYWRDQQGKGRILTITPGFRLVALDAASGLPVKTFGANGAVDLWRYLRGFVDDPPDIGSTSPPLIVDNVVVVGPAHLTATRPKSRQNVKGDVHAYDADTGALLWTFKTIPEAGDASTDDWQEGSAAYTGNAGVWAPMSADPELGLIYLPVETPTGDYYGGERPGKNLYGNSIVCLEAATGKIKWHFQTTHHDIWDWDLPAAPILIDIPRNDGVVKAVAQITKQAFLYVFNRQTGEALWPIEERPVPQSNVPGEKTWPTQPYPTKPAPFDRQGITKNDLIDFTPELRAEALEAIKPYKLGAMYSPHGPVDAADGTKGVITLPSVIGGGNWEGGAVDPETGILYVGSSTLPAVVNLEPAPEGSDAGYVAVLESLGFGGLNSLTVRGLPIVKPPWGRITAIDLKSGDHIWMQPNGEAPDDVKNNPALEGVDIGRTGKPIRAGLLATKTLLFAGEGWGGAPVLRAHDKMTGKILAEIDLPGSQTGLPMSYVWEGKQYIVMTVSDGKNPAELVALALPQN